MENSEQIMHWESFKKNSDVFKNNKPFRFVFVEDCINNEFYEKIFQTYPKYDDLWVHYQDYSRSSENLE